jgi:hypothetical protein
MPSKVTQNYFIENGCRGGQKSRSALSRKQAQKMVAVRLARAAYVKYRTHCLWSFRRDLKITLKNAGWVAEQLRKNGNLAVWKIGKRIESLLRDD